MPPLSALLTNIPAGGAPSSAGRSLLNIMTGGFRSRRPAEPQATEPQRAEPSFPAQQEQQAPARQANPEEALEIPAFLRRQSS